MDSRVWLRAVEQEMEALLASPDPRLYSFYGMMRYHLGWLDRHLEPVQSDGGKRIRPWLCLLACAAVGGDAARALPAAAAIELLHNFSLIHDDIEDNSPLRRHRETVWAIWGVPQAINVGDGMLMLSRLALHRLRERGVAADRVLQVARMLDDTCLRLCQGQYLDISFEERSDITVEEYLFMIGGKSASLIAASAEIGAALGTDDAAMVAAYRDFGWELGLAFQMVDDILGIWGDPAVTGKSAASDILSRKKTLPILYTLARGDARSQALHSLYARPNLDDTDIARVVELLEQSGALADVQARAETHTDRALAALARTGIVGPAQEQLREIARSFLTRTK